jgi:GTPase SAR1 family protein
MTKQRSSRVLYKSGYLNELRGKVIAKYLDDIRAKGKYVIKFTTDKNHRNILAIRFHLNHVLKEYRGIDLLQRFFYRELDENENEKPLLNDMWFETSSIEYFEKYLNTELDEDTGGYYLKNGKINGCEVIDREYIANLKKNQKGLTWEDFYFGKERDNCQWVGVLNDWHCERSEFKKVLNIIKESFSWEPVVAAFIHGTGGVGKTTFLRSVCKSMVLEGYIILWLENLQSFLNDNLRHVNRNLKYVLVIDDWSLFEEENLAATELFKKLSQVDNIKLVIANRKIFKTRFKKYVLGNSYFEITAEDNNEILNKAIGYYPEWKSIVENFPFKDIKKTSIFIIFFVIANSLENRSIKKTTGILARFLNILEEDLTAINVFFPGMAKAIYHLANIYNNHGITFTWSALTTLAIEYGDHKASNYFLYDEDNPVCKIMSRYIFLDRLLLPVFYDCEVVYFHHKTLLEEGFCKINIEGLYFNEGSVILEMIDIFFRNNEDPHAMDLINVYSLNTIDDEPAEIKQYTTLIKSPTFYSILALSNTFEQIYKEAKTITGEDFWQGRLATILHLCERRFPPHYTRAILIILKKVGCTAQCITDAINLSENDDKHLDKLYQTLLQQYIKRFEEYEAAFVLSLISNRELIISPMDTYPKKPPYVCYSLDAFEAL